MSWFRKGIVLVCVSSHLLHIDYLLILLAKSGHVCSLSNIFLGPRKMFLHYRETSEASRVVGAEIKNLFYSLHLSRYLIVVFSASSGFSFVCFSSVFVDLSFFVPCFVFVFLVFSVFWTHFLFLDVDSYRLSARLVCRSRAALLPIFLSSKPSDFWINELGKLCLQPLCLLPRAVCTSLPILIQIWNIKILYTMGNVSSHKSLLHAT